MRNLWFSFCAGLLVTGTLANAAPQARIIAAEYGAPTDRYDHGVLGDAIEWGALELTVDKCPDCTVKQRRKVTIRLPENRVFEDVAPRLADLDGDENPEVIVVETDIALGARLAVYDETGLVAAAPFIGRTHRWLAPVGAADFDRDGSVEIAYVDRPHLAKTLLLWRFKDGQLRQVATYSSVTNHRIGDAEISGGVRDCGQGPEMIVASSNWGRVLSVVWSEAGKLISNDLAPNRGPQSFAAALSCKN